MGIEAHIRPRVEDKGWVLMLLDWAENVEDLANDVANDFFDPERQGYVLLHLAEVANLAAQIRVQVGYAALAADEGR